MAWFKLLLSKPRAALAALCAVAVYFLFACIVRAPAPQYPTAKLGKLDIEDTVLAGGGDTIGRLPRGGLKTACR
ncbi:MAG: hypothetical protein WAK01_02325 [Methylocystis sp.]